MSAALMYQEKRQFGRRETNIRGRAVARGSGGQEFSIRNISDGGALLVFDEPFVAGRTFRIEIDGTDFVLLCEVRHQDKSAVGVSFMRACEGAALNRHFQLRPVEGLDGASSMSAPAPLARPRMPIISNQALRDALRATHTLAQRQLDTICRPRLAAWKCAVLAVYVDTRRCLDDAGRSQAYSRDAHVRRETGWA